MERINQIHPSIKFTVEGSVKEVHFLDTVGYKNQESRLVVKPYVKPTDRNNYLHFQSFHRRQLKVNIPYGQAPAGLEDRSSTEKESFNLGQSSLC